MKKITTTEKYENGKLVERITVEEKGEETTPLPNFPWYPKPTYPQVWYDKITGGGSFNRTY